tara:strand:+ start:14949 stop:15767 length:819 start_codon:yes stop_codon:yes gene_type:complete
MIKKSAISLISYDSYMLADSIRSYYNYVDEIILGLDEDRVSWSKNKFTFDESKLWKELQTIDGDNKISIIEHNFHESNVPIENDNFERNYLKSQCKYDWLFSFDADEVLVNPHSFFLKYVPLVEPYYDKVNMTFTWFLPYKKLEEDYLVIATDDGRFFKGDTQGFTAIKQDTYTYCRWTSCSRRLASPLAIMHWSFCREEAAVDQKINNFGHSDKTGSDPFFPNWKLIDRENYMNLRNFKTSGFGEAQWEKLILVPGNELMPRAKQEAEMIL